MTEKISVPADAGTHSYIQYGILFEDGTVIWAEENGLDIIKVGHLRVLDHGRSSRILEFVRPDPNSRYDKFDHFVNAYHEHLRTTNVIPNEEFPKIVHRHVFAIASPYTEGWLR